jgi:hypothetical protein
MLETPAFLGHHDVHCRYLERPRRRSTLADHAAAWRQSSVRCLGQEEGVRPLSTCKTAVSSLTELGTSRCTRLPQRFIGDMTPIHKTEVATSTLLRWV